MVQINFALKEVNCKIVYYGPGLSGKTTNLEIVHKKAPRENRGELTSIATEGDRTLFFDFMPLDLGTISGMRTRFQLYTVPGQVYYNSTRKLVLQGVDGIVFVADSSREKLEENLASWENLKENLKEYGRDLRDIPTVIQYNKRDLKDRMEIQELEEKLNEYQVPCFEAVATTGEGIFPTLKALSAAVLESLNKGDGRAHEKASPKDAEQREVGEMMAGASVSSEKKRSFSAGEDADGRSFSSPVAAKTLESPPSQKPDSAHVPPRVPPRVASPRRRPKTTARPYQRVYFDPKRSKREKAGNLFTIILCVLLVCTLALFFLILLG